MLISELLELFLAHNKREFHYTLFWMMIVGSSWVMLINFSCKIYAVISGYNLQTVINYGSRLCRRNSNLIPFKFTTLAFNLLLDWKSNQEKEPKEHTLLNNDDHFGVEQPGLLVQSGLETPKRSISDMERW